MSRPGAFSCGETTLCFPRPPCRSARSADRCRWPERSPGDRRPRSASGAAPPTPLRCGRRRGRKTAAAKDGAHPIRARKAARKTAARPAASATAAAPCRRAPVASRNLRPASASIGASLRQLEICTDARPREGLHASEKPEMQNGRRCFGDRLRWSLDEKAERLTPAPDPRSAAPARPDRSPASAPAPD